MQKFRLKRVSKKIKKDIFDYIKEWYDNGEQTIIPSACNLGNLTFDEWYKKIKSLENKCVANMVPSTLFAFYVDKKLVGFLDLRHNIDTTFLEEYGGHIGYGIRPSERNKGYASLMLSYGLIEAFKLGLNKVLITCKENNIASKKVILSNDGYFDRNTVLIENNKKSIVERYYIDFYKV